MSRNPLTPSRPRASKSKSRPKRTAPPPRDPAAVGEAMARAEGGGQS